MYNDLVLPCVSHWVWFFSCKFCHHSATVTLWDKRARSALEGLLVILIHDKNNPLWYSVKGIGMFLDVLLSWLILTLRLVPTIVITIQLIEFCCYGFSSGFGSHGALRHPLHEVLAVPKMMPASLPLYVFRSPRLLLLRIWTEFVWSSHRLRHRLPVPWIIIQAYLW